MSLLIEVGFRHIASYYESSEMRTLKYSQSQGLLTCNSGETYRNHTRMDVMRMSAALELASQRVITPYRVVGDRVIYKVIV